MLKLALVGKDIQHSASPKLYQRLITQPFEYDLLDYQSPLEIPLLKDILTKYYAINITAPYKKHFLAEVDENHSPVDGVNTIMRHNNKFVATNTDYLACRDILQNLNNIHKPSNYILLGDGVMAKLMAYIFEQSGLEYQQVSRRLDNFSKMDQFIKPNKNTLIINACSRSYNFSSASASTFIFWDLNYSHLSNETEVKKSGSLYIDGLGLLELQAKYALSFWNV